MYQRFFYMRLTGKQAEQRLSSPNNLANRLAEFRKSNKLQLDVDSNTLAVSAGRKLPRLPERIKQEIADKALTGEYTQKELAEEYGVSQPAIGAIKRSAEAKNLAIIDNVDEQVKNMAVEKMMLAMGLIDEDSLTQLRATELASISSQMAKVYAAANPKQNQVAVNLVIYSPEIKEEKSYPVVEIAAESSPSGVSSD